MMGQRQQTPGPSTAYQGRETWPRWLGGEKQAAGGPAGEQKVSHRRAAEVTGTTDLRRRKIIF